MEAVLNQNFVRNLAIPPRPEIVAVLLDEMYRDEPDLARVTKKISSDVGLSAAMLKAANSPAFGLSRKMTSVSQAVDFLGMRNVSGIATGLAMRHSFGNSDSPGQRRFWDRAEKAALLCAKFARMLRGIPPDEAYTFGLFHDCGIPLLMRHFPDYETTLERAYNSEDARLSAVEQADVGTHHGAVGYFLTRAWQLPDDFCRAVLWHHDTEVFEDRSVDEPVRNLVGLIHLAESVLDRLLDEATVEWERFEAYVLDHFGLDHEDFLGFVDAGRDTVAA